jgi:hypothetical protein
MTHPTPNGGGSYVREKDGSLRLVEEPTAFEPKPQAAVEAAAESPVEEPVKTPVKPTRKEA